MTGRSEVPAWRLGWTKVPVGDGSEMLGDDMGNGVTEHLHGSEAVDLPDLVRR